MVRVVLDTNVLASATIVKEGAPSRIVQAWLQGEVELVTSPVLLQELADVLSRPRIQKYQWMATEEVAQLLTHLATVTILVSGQRLVRVITDDPDDDFVLSTALEGKVDYIVSGDRHLLNLGDYQGIQIVPPAEFFRTLAK